MLKKLLKPFPRLNTSILPTPIHKLEHISGLLDCRLFCMRDDLTGLAYGGNKTRKLDFLIADAKQKNADAIIGIGANQSNFCRLATAAATVHGLETYLVLAGKKPDKPTGNLLVDHLLGANIEHVDTESDEILTEKSLILERKLISQGKKVYRMPSGGSTPIGVLGYLEAFYEIAVFSEQNNIYFDHIIHASGSGGTQAGLALGKSLLSGVCGKITGISVGRDKPQLTERVRRLATETADMLNVDFETKHVEVDDNFIGERYGIKTPEGTRAIELFAKKEGIILDEVYTGKAAAGLINFAEKKRFNTGENILFIHTGGNIQLFA